MRRHRQYKHMWSCVSQDCGKFLCGNLQVFYKALLLASEFPTLCERFFMVCFNSSSSGSMKKIPRNLLALSSFGFSKAHFRFAFRCIRHMLPHIQKYIVGSWGCLFPRQVSSDHVYPSGGLSFNKVNLVQPVHASDDSLSPLHSSDHQYVSSNKMSNDVWVVLVPSMYFSGIGNVWLGVPHDGDNWNLL